MSIIYNAGILMVVVMTAPLLMEEV